MKNALIVVLLVLLNACASNTYIAPVGTTNAVLDVFPPTSPKISKFIPQVILYIDGMRVNTKSEPYPVMPVQVTPGLHRLNLEITAYTNSRAKFVKLELELHAKESQKYKLLIVTPKTFDGDIQDDLPATVKVVSDQNEVIYNKEVILADNWGRSGADPNAVDETTRAIILSTIPY